jgi:hypothetical protein
MSCRYVQYLQVLSLLTLGVWCLTIFFMFSQIERIKKREGVYRERVSAAGVKV